MTGLASVWVRMVLAGLGCQSCGWWCEVWVEVDCLGHKSFGWFCRIYALCY